jgi:hypothetical protein
VVTKRYGWSGLVLVIVLALLHAAVLGGRGEAGAGGESEGLSCVSIVVPFILVSPSLVSVLAPLQPCDAPRSDRRPSHLISPRQPSVLSPLPPLFLCEQVAMGGNGSGKRRDVPGCSRMPPPELADERELGGDGSRSNPVGDHLGYNVANCRMV